MKEQIKQLIDILNDNEDGKTYSENNWLIKATTELLEIHVVTSVDIYGIGEIDNLKEDLASLGTEVVIDTDNKFTKATSSSIEVIAEEDPELDFEIDNKVTLMYKENSIPLIDDMKENEEVLFDETKEIIIMTTEHIYTSDRGLDSKKRLTIYVPYNLVEILDEEVGY